MTLGARVEAEMGWHGIGDTLYDDVEEDVGAQWTKRTHESRAVPETLAMDDNDGLDQWKVTDRILLDGLRETEPRIDYENVRPKDLPLSSLAHMWEHDHADAAMALLFKKHRLTIDDRYLLQISKGNVVLTWMGVSDRLQKCA